jgi:hypothetical protein
MGSPAPLDLQYTSALGKAVFEFARLEWLAVQCCDRIRAGSIEELSERTAGRVADTLLHLARQLDPSPAAAALQEAALDFNAYVGTRNNLLHAKPGFNADGEERLFRDGDQWTIAELDAVSLAFHRCAARLESWLRDR